MTNPRPTADELCSAIKKYDRDRDINPVRLLLEQGADPNAMDANGALPLILASRFSFPLVEMLVEHGADVNAESKLGHTSLSACIVAATTAGNEADCTKILHFLIVKGADLEHMDTMGVSPLLWAESVKNKTAMEILVNAIRRPGDLHRIATARQEALKKRHSKFKPSLS